MSNIFTLGDKFAAIIDGKTVKRSNRRALERMLKRTGPEHISVEPVKSEFSVTQRFDFISKFVKLISKNRINSLIVTGSPGVGKTHTVNEILQESGLVEDTIGETGDYISIKGHSTAKALYRLLWENNGKVIVFDDADSVFKDPTAANLLKGALDTTPKRVISWHAEFSENEELPNRFEFTGRVVFISNLSIKDFPPALISRSFCVDLSLDIDEKIERIEHIFTKIKADHKVEVLDFIRSNKTKMKDLNVRMACKALTLANSTDEDEWKDLALYSMTL
jgi:hypothetical protein